MSAPSRSGTVAPRVIVVGAGIGGLAAAVDLAVGGAEVTVCDRFPVPGGKMRRQHVGEVALDAGPTVFTMREVFEALFADAGARLEDRVRLKPLSVLARHAWTGGGALDLFADIDASAEAIGAFAGEADADAYRRFCVRAGEVYATLKSAHVLAQKPNPLSLAWRVGDPRALLRTAPFATYWSTLARTFRDPRLRQLFARYATYVGSSPRLAPATLMLIAHVEQAGVWRIEGGMRALADALLALGTEAGARYRLGLGVARIVCAGGRVAGLELEAGAGEGGERLVADAVVFAGDVSALGEGLLGPDATPAAPPTPRAARSLSAVTWRVHAPTRGGPLAHHTVVFGSDYAREFEAVFRDRTLPAEPTVYVCAQDRDDRGGGVEPGAPERLLVLINAPPDGDLGPLDEGAARAKAWGMLARAGIEIGAGPVAPTTPADFAHAYPATGGALYGRAVHGAFATFARPGAASAVPGLYLAGGTVHPGAGVPMAATSGRLAAARLLADWAAGRRGGRRLS